MKGIVSTVVLIISSLYSFAQVTNVTWALSPNQDKITISYDLAAERFFDVYIEARLDEKVLKPLNISGDVGKYLKGGSGKQAVWDILRDNLELEGKLEIKVAAIDLLDDIAGKQSGEKTEPVRIKTGGGGKTSALIGLALGLGSVGYGLSLESKSKDLYSVYKSNRLESAPVFQNQSREDHYLDANRKHKSGLLFLSTGGVAVLYGVYQLIHKGSSHSSSTSSRDPKFNFSPSFSTTHYANQLRLLPGASAALRF